MSVANEVKEFYCNDVVYRFNKRKHISFGMVMDSYEASTDSDDYSLQKGQIRVWWPNHSREQVCRQNKVHLMSRNIMPGDVVRRLEQGKETQRGYCKEAKQYATVQIVGTDKIVERIPKERLKAVNSYDIDVPVCLGNKYGRIQSVDQLVTMKAKCGSVVSFLSSINHDIEEYWLSKWKRVYFDAFYPGQEVACVPSHLEDPVWVQKSKSMRKSMHTRHRFTVQQVEPSSLEVLWYSCDSGYPAKAEDLKPEDIKKLKLAEPLENCFLELGERRLLKINSSDTIAKKQDWISKQSALHRPGTQKVTHNKHRKSKGSRIKLQTPSFLTASVDSQEQDDDSWTSADNEEYSDSDVTPGEVITTNVNTRHFPPKPKEVMPGRVVPIEVLCTVSKATIVWQDGSEEKEIPTTQLYFSMSLDDHEFFPGEWVIDGDKEDSNRYGAIQHVNYLERTATVKWFKRDLNEEQLPEVICTNEMSVYDLRKHPKYEFRPGSVVKRTPTVENKIGHVIDSCPEGYVLVLWIDGSTEKCWPQNIELIPHTAAYSESEDDDTQFSWETESVESIAGDYSDETTLQNMAARLDFVRNRILYLKEAFRQHPIPENFTFLRDLLIVYDNSSYLDKLLGTSFFSLKSKHFQALLSHVKERAKILGVELHGRLFSCDNLAPSSTKLKIAEKENINKVIKLQRKINAEIRGSKDNLKESGEPSSPLSPEPTDLMNLVSEESLCVELLSMLKIRMDLAYAEIISRIGGPQALSVMTKASDEVATPMTTTPVTPETSFSNISPFKLLKSVINCENESYSIIDEAHESHHYYSSTFDPADKPKFFKAVQKQYKLLQESLPPGVWVRSYANRLDLLSVMIRGPNKTPYEDGVFLFDIQLSHDFPSSPPLCHYISYCSERLNPNLYVDGKVCVSLLGTWLGKGTEVWGPKSTLLQLFVSIQGLILVSEPYYNEAGYEKQFDSQQGVENSRTYNEFVILKLVQSMTQMLKTPPHIFKEEILSHFAMNGKKMCKRLLKYCSDVDPLEPEFPLQPVSKGFKLTLNASLNTFQDVLEKVLNEHKK